MEEPEMVQGEPCPVCHEKKLMLMEKETEVPCKYEFEITSEEDMKVRVVKSGEATVKLPHITTIEPGAGSQGFVTNIEGILKRVQYQIENVKENAEDDDDKQKAKNLLKKLQKVMWGQEKLKITIEDPSGNSAIVSDKAVKTSLKGKKAK